MENSASNQYQSTSLNHVQINEFSGPLDLLLQLIRDHEMDIFQIDICEITKKYIEYINNVPTPNVENAGDFIRMASMLVYIKSRTLLAKDEEDDEESSNLKKDLVRLLVNYQRYQVAGELLFQRGVLNRDVWKTSHELMLKAVSTNEVEINRDKASFLLIQAYNKMMKSVVVKKPHKTKERLPSLLDRVKELAHLFAQGVKTNFNDLIAVKKHRYSKLLTFLSLLELSKLGFVSISQSSLWSNIDVMIKKNINEKDFILLNNEEIDWMNSDSDSDSENSADSQEGDNENN